MTRAALAVGLLLAALPAAAQFTGDKTDGSPNANIVRWAKGAYEYRTLKEGVVRGSEDFHLTVHPDGSRTMRAVTDITARDISMNVIARVDARFRPIEVYFSYFRAGVLRASGLIGIDGNALTASSNGISGKITRAEVVPENIAVVSHPLALDGWTSWYVAPRPDIAQTGAIYMLNTGADPTAPLLDKVTTQRFVYHGEEQVTVPAGTFTASRITMDGHSDVWVHGPDRILVRYVWAEIDRDYVLKTLDVGPTP